MKSWLLPVRTLFGLALGAAVIMAAGCAAVLKGPLYGADKLARSVWAVYLGVISEGFTVKDLRNRLSILSQPGVHLFLANHPPAITTLILAAWAGIMMWGRVVIVLREDLPLLVSWVMKVTAVGVFIKRGDFDERAFQQGVLAKLEPHRGHPVILLCFPDRSRPRLTELEADHARVRRDHLAAYEEACFPGRLHTRVPRVTGLQALFAVLPSDTTVTQVIVGHKGQAGWAIQPWGVWRPLVVRLAPAQELFGERGEVLRLSLYRAWAEAADTLERWATTE